MSTKATYHAPGFARAHSLALQGKVNRGETWSPPPAPKLDDCLGVGGAHPVIKGNTLYRSGIVAARAATMVGRGDPGTPEICAACDRLLKIIDEKKGMTAAKVETRRHVAGLRASPPAFSDRSVEVDVDAGIIKNVALLTVGPTLGHGFDIDETTVDQLVSLSNQEADGVRCRFKHPEITQKPGADGEVIQTVSDDTGSLVGRIKNVRRDGQQARGDVHLGSYAEIMPGLGNVREYLLRHAQDDPAGIGMSAMFEFDVDPQTDRMGNVISLPARLTALYAIDFVGTPAANPAGLLSAKPLTPNPALDIFGRRVSSLACLQAIATHGPLHLGSLVARTGFRGRWESLRADVEWLVNRGFAEKTGQAQYKATPSGLTQAAMRYR